MAKERKQKEAGNQEAREGARNIFSANWTSLIKPTGYVQKPVETNVSTFVIEPLENGMATTLGNALRRVLLSSLQGAAVSSLKIEGVVHEYSSIPGVREDVSDLILNVKQIAIKYGGTDRKKMNLKNTEWLQSSLSVKIQVNTSNSSIEKAANSSKFILGDELPKRFKNDLGNNKYLVLILSC